MTESGLYSTTLKGQPSVQLVQPTNKDSESAVQHNAEKYNLEHHI